jgi:hypothetical protein
VFTEVNRVRGGEELGVSVQLVDSTAISFSIAERVLKVGDKHSNVENPTDMFAKVVHEYGIHVGRFISGLRSGSYISAYGNYDYLDFEEGLASVFEQVIKGKLEKPSPQNLGHYVHIGLAKGLDGMMLRDFRSVFEIAWRYRLLMNIKPGQPITVDMIEDTKRKTYDYTIKRIFRGTPSYMRGVVFPKDLTYLRGRLKATEYLNDNVHDDETFEALFLAKYDPTNEIHSKVVAKSIGVIR